MTAMASHGSHMRHPMMSHDSPMAVHASPMEFPWQCPAWLMRPWQPQDSPMNSSIAVQRRHGDHMAVRGQAHVIPIRSKATAGVVSYFLRSYSPEDLNISPET